MNYTEGDVKVNGVSIHYYRTGGDKPPFVLLHGATDNGLCWTPFAQFLSLNYDVIMIDAQGHGKSDRLTKDFQYLDHARQVVSLLEQLKISKPFIMGHSMGAGTTVNIAVEYPEVPKAIILEDPAWMEQSKEAAANDQQIRDDFARRQEKILSQTVEEIKADGHRDNPIWSEAELIPWAESKKQYDPSLFSVLRIDRPTYRELVPRIKCPLLLITSENGIVRPEVAANAKILWKSKNPFTWVKIDGAGHNIRREQFNKFIEAVTNFLTVVERGK